MLRGVHNTAFCHWSQRDLTSREELFTISGIFTKNVSDDLLNAKPYSRCLAAHLALYETLVGLKLKAENDGVINQDHPLSRFWSTYIYLIDLCLCQLYAEKTGDWELYIQVLTSMIPVFFATDRQNYARWLSIHVHDMKGLEKRAPAVHSEFANGNFTVKRSAKKFSAVSADMALEQSINRDVKCQGRLIGKSSTDSARNKWFYTSHVKATVSASLHDMIDLSGSAYGESDTHHTDNNYDQQKSVEWPEKLKNYMRQQEWNPFIVTGDCEQLTNTITGRTLSTEDTEKVLSSLAAATDLHLKFVNERLLKKEMKLKERIPNMAIPYREPSRKNQSLIKMKKKATKANENLGVLSRIIGAAGNLNVEQVLTDMESYPPSLAEDDGSFLKSGDKAQLKHVLLKEAAVDENDAPVHTDVDKEVTALIIDGMGFVRRSCNKVSCETFGEFADSLLIDIVKQMRQHKASRCDVIFDRYILNSIKAMERRKRAEGKPKTIMTIHNSQTKTPKNWDGFLIDSGNKAKLIRFLGERWKTGYEKLTLQELITVSTAEDAYSITKHTVIDEKKFENNHEEADTIIMLHLKSMLQVYKSVTILCDDTDVLVLSLYYANKWKTTTEIWMYTKQQYIPVSKMADKLGDKCEVLIGLHTISGCDTVGSISGITKLKAYRGLTAELKSIGEKAFDPTELHGFIYNIYGVKDLEGDLEQLRYLLICERGQTGHKLPPTNDEFALHCLRAHLQACVWKQADLQMMETPDPAKSGWTVDHNGLFIPRYSKSSNAVKVSDLVASCHCTTGCSTQRCSCRRKSKNCSDICSCRGCSNTEER